MNLLSILLQEPVAAPQNNYMGWVMIVALFVIMWLFMIRPQQKKQKEVAKMREALKSGDHVVTSGGIYGVIKHVNEGTFTIEIAKDIQIKVDKTSVFAVPNEPAAGK